MKIQFLGGAQTVTGSKTLVTSGKHRVLVDCGLFQGLKDLRLRNWEPFPVDPRLIDAVLLTHAHLDHSGALPLLVKGGFRGRIFASAPTRELAALLLADSAKIHEEDADFANRHGHSKHHPALPIYTLDDVKRTLTYFETASPGRWNELPGRLRFRLMPSSHILGSTFVELEGEGQSLGFSGDLGRSQPILYAPPEGLERVDTLVIESTYGDRTHHSTGADGVTLDRLAQLIERTRASGGQLIVPAFAVGRVQELLYLLSKLKKDGRLSLPVYLDSPMGLSATQIFLSHPGWHKLTPSEVEELEGVATMLRSQNESIAFMRKAPPAILIAGSGMVSGGRVLHHLAARLSDARNTVLLVGFQSAGTRGRLLQDGISELKMHGRYVPVAAAVEQLTGLSAHADQSEILGWLRRLPAPPRMTFINHGEPQASDALRVKITDVLGWPCEVPKLFQEYELPPRAGA